MKKITLILMFFALNYMAFGQCPIEQYISFDTQQEIDDFAINYPNCTEIQGSLRLSGANIVNLQGLSNITTITGSLWMTGSSGWVGYNPFSVNNLTGLENLSTVGGDFTLGLADNITDLTGLNSLTTVGGKLSIGYYTYGADTSDPAYATGNASLISLNGLDNLSSISDLEIAYNANLSTCNDPFICNYLQTGGQGNIHSNASGCNTAAEILNSCVPACTEQDSLALLALRNATNGANWANTWNLNAPINTWHGVTMSADGCNVLELNLSNNNLVGTIPSEIGELSALTRLLFHNNSLSGNIPGTIGNLSELVQLWLFGNQLSGELPTEIGNLSNLTHFGVGGNQLTGTIPASYGNLSNLGFFTLKNNQLSGCFDTNLLNICAAGNDAQISNGNNFDASWSAFCTNSEGSCSPPPPVTCRYLDSLVLIDLYNATNGANWSNSWNTAQPIDTWHGVILNFDECVKELNLYSNNLLGTLPATIGELSALTFLELSANQLSGSIPPELGNLDELDLLGLSVNQLSGSIPPELSNLDKLQLLGLNNNQLSGNIPPELGEMDRLDRLHLWNNQLTGNIPPELGNIELLNRLSVHHNQLSGGIPPELGNLNNLVYFHVNDNQLSGCFDDNLLNICAAGSDGSVNDGNNFDALWSTFCANGDGGCTPPPSTCGYLDSLVLVTLYQSTNGPNWNTTWNLNQAMTTWHGITLNADGCVMEINLPQNNLNGIIPPAVGELAAMTRFNLHSNALMGGIPSTIGNASELRQIWLFNNQLSGILAPEIGNLTHLTHFGVGKNQLTGTIPASYGNLTNLTLLTLPLNQLSGCFDDNLTNICNAAGNSNINSGNNFDALWSDFCANGAGNCSTPPPVTCSNTDSLALVSLYNSTNGANWNSTWNLTQAMSTWYGVTLNADGCVMELNLSNNNLVGTIPTEIGNLSALTRLLLHTNNLSGSIPATIGDLSELRQMWLFANQLSGALPPEIGNLSELTHLGLGGNQLSGSIPGTYGFLSNLGFLALKNNNLSGCYDANLTNICAAGTNSRVSSGNNFSASWSAFCTNLVGCCNCRLDMSDNLVEIEENLINLYPNPANQFINIDIQIKNDSKLNYVIYNTLGEMVQSGQIEGQTGTHPYPIELNDLNTGIYYFNLMTGDKETTKHFTVIR